MQLSVLYEDNHLLVLNKPPMLATMGVDASRTSLLQLAKRYIGNKYGKPGNVYLGVVSRLDLPASGVIVFARTSKAAARLNRQYLERHVQKTYWAIVSPRMDQTAGEMRDWLARDESSHRMRVHDSPQTGAQEAVATYRVLKSAGDRQWLELELQTGRRHQLRAQLAARGHPILGDRRYGSRDSFTPGIALHSRTLVLDHPTKGTAMRWDAPVPSGWPV